jgi:hypothetical protein
VEFPGLSYERTGAIRLYGGNSSPVIGVGWRGFCCAQHVVALITQVLVDAVRALPRSRASIGFGACPVKIVETKGIALRRADSTPGMKGELAFLANSKKSSAAFSSRLT